MSEEKTKPEDQKPKAAKVEIERSIFHVVGPGSVQFKGKAHAAGSELRLTDEEARDLGDSVAEGAAPPAPEEIAKRKGGRYVVAGPGSVWHDGGPRQKGYELKLDEAEARKLGAAVTPAG